MSETATIAPETQGVPVQELDASCRVPVLIFFSSAVKWLAVGLVLLLISSIKLHGPGFLGDTAWLTLGRVRPAALNAILYGFACQAAFGIILWLTCRLARAPLVGSMLAAGAGAAWNVAVTLGVIAILAGASTGFVWLEMPVWLVPPLFAAYAIIGGCALLTFAARRPGPLYPSLWFVFAALFWFPWVYSASNLLLHVVRVRGVMQPAVNAWYTNGLMELWLMPVALAAIYYFIPRIAGRPLHSRGLALVTFWTLALGGSWTAFRQLVGGPLPAWMTSTGVGAGIVMLAPVTCAVVNWGRTLCPGGECGKAMQDLTLRYVLFAAGCYVVAAVEGVLIGGRGAAGLLHFTYVETARTHLMIFGAFGMAALGAMHYIVPRLIQGAWPSERRSRRHFAWSAVGIVLYFAALTAAGWKQGTGIANPNVSFVDAIKSTVPFLGLATMGLVLFLVAQVMWLINVTGVLREAWTPWCECLWTSVRGGKTREARA